MIDKKFKRAYPNYIIQSLLAAVTTLVILFFLGVVAHAAIVAALGSTAFIIFTMPHSATARPRRVIGGHIMGLGAGTLSYLALVFLHLGNGPFTRELVHVAAAALSVGLSIFLMVTTNTEHPPAAGTALGLVAHGWRYQTVFFVLVAAVIMSLVRYWMGPRLRDLL